MGGIDGKREGHETPPIENEIKILAVDPRDVFTRFKNSGITPSFVGEVKNIRFDTDDGALERSGVSARVRRLTTHDGHTEYRWTIKTNAPLNDEIGKRRFEIKSKNLDLQFDTEDDALQSLIEHLRASGHTTPESPLKEIRRITKARMSYKFPEGHRFHGATVDVDQFRTINGSSTYEGRPLNEIIFPFLEIEGIDEGQQRDVAKFLGLRIHKEDASLSEIELIRRYCPNIN